MVLNEAIFGVGVRVSCCGGHTAVQKDTQGHMEVLLYSGLNMNSIPQEILVDWPLILPVICAKKL